MEADAVSNIAPVLAGKQKFFADSIIPIE
jgi:hypothetical protein